MATLLGIFITALTLLIISLPWLRKTYKPADIGFRRLREVREQRQSIYKEIKALTLDHQLGNMETEDYLAQLEGNRRSAATLLQEEEILKVSLATLNEDDRVEAMVLEAKNISEGEESIKDTNEGDG